VSEVQLAETPLASVPEFGGLETYCVMPIAAFTFVAMTASWARDEPQDFSLLWMILLRSRACGDDPIDLLERVRLYQSSLGT